MASKSEADINAATAATTPPRVGAILAMGLAMRAEIDKAKETRKSREMIGEISKDHTARQAQQWPTFSRLGSNTKFRTMRIMRSASSPQFSGVAVKVSDVTVKGSDEGDEKVEFSLDVVGMSDSGRFVGDESFKEQRDGLDDNDFSDIKDLERGEKLIDSVDLSDITRLDANGKVMGISATDEAKDIKATDVVKDIKAADEVKDIKATDEVKDIKAANEATDIKDADEAKDIKATDEAKDIKGTDEAKDIKTADEVKDIKVVDEAKDIKATGEAKDIKPTDEAKEIKATDEAKDIKARDEVNDINATDDKDMKATEDTVRLLSINRSEGDEEVNDEQTSLHNESLSDMCHGRTADIEGPQTTLVIVSSFENSQLEVEGIISGGLNDASLYDGSKGPETNLGAVNGCLEDGGNINVSERSESVDNVSLSDTNGLECDGEAHGQQATSETVIIPECCSHGGDESDARIKNRQSTPDSFPTCNQFEYNGKAKDFQVTYDIVSLPDLKRSESEEQVITGSNSVDIISISDTNGLESDGKIQKPRTTFVTVSLIDSDQLEDDRNINDRSDSLDNVSLFEVVSNSECDEKVKDQKDNLDIVSLSDIYAMSPEEFKSLIKNPHLKTDSEDSVIDKIIRWVTQCSSLPHGQNNKLQKGSRSNFLLELMMSTRYLLMSTTYLWQTFNSEPLVQTDPICQALVDEIFRYKTRFDLHQYSCPEAALHRSSSTRRNVILFTFDDNFFIYDPISVSDVSYQRLELQRQFPDRVRGIAYTNNTVYVLRLSQKKKMNFEPELGDNVVFVSLLKTCFAFLPIGTDLVTLNTENYNSYTIEKWSTSYPISDQWCVIGTLLNRPVKKRPVLVTNVGSKLVIFWKESILLKTVLTAELFDLRSAEEIRSIHLSMVRNRDTSFVAFKEDGKVFILQGDGMLWHLQISGDDPYIELVKLKKLWKGKRELKGAVIIAGVLHLLADSPIKWQKSQFLEGVFKKVKIAVQPGPVFGFVHAVVQRGVTE